MKKIFLTLILLLTASLCFAKTKNGAECEKKESPPFQVASLNVSLAD